MKVAYYRLEMPPETDLSLPEVLRKINHKAKDKRVIRHNMAPYKMSHVSAPKGQNISLGNIERIQMDGLPVRGRLNEDSIPFDLESDEGVGYETAFLYDSELSIVALQKGRNCAGVGALSTYFQLSCDLGGPVHIRPVLSADALQKLSGTNVYKKLRFKFARCEHLGFLNDTKVGNTPAAQPAQWAAEILETLGALDVEIMASMGRLGGTLKSRAVQRLVRALQRLSDDREEVVTLQVRAETDDGVELLDFLKFKMVDEVPLETKDRHVDHKQRWSALRGAFQARKSELASMFGD